uniref:Uncharacterized protein n=1 Tax=uncultured Bacillota bacterium TaxID=344338 RepID=A0A650EPW7_9FIRM|nr:hypothetical protein Firmicute1046_0500 [uncultured Firmicutes bacterium]
MIIRQEERIPEYYPTMYLDGYTPEEILIAMQKLTRNQFEIKRATEQISHEMINEILFDNKKRK